MSNSSISFEMSSVVDVVVGPKSNKRRINFLTSKIEELSSELLQLEALEEEFEAFRSSKVTKRTKGRPQAKKVVEDEVDLFANLVKEVVSSSEDNNNDGSSEVPVVSKPETAEPVPAPAKKEKVVKEKVVKEKPVKHVLTEEEKAAKKAELDAEKLEKAAAKKLQLEQEKIANAEMKKAQLEADKVLKAQEKASMAAADKESKKVQLEQEKAAKAEAKKAQIEAEKALKTQVLYEAKMAAALKKLEAKQFKEMEQEKKKALKAKPATNKKSKAETPVVVSEVTAPVEKVTVSRITINDIKYLKSSTNILYNPDTREEVGLYDPETKSIKALPDDEEEEMTEDTYESDDE